ncbi:radical SAM protein [bacterium]|nr:radical SAM protein [bacterium]
MAGGILERGTLAEEAFAVRRAHFPDVIDFYAPGLKRYSTEEFEQRNPRTFLPISVTGSSCALQCDHCAAKILEPMIPLTKSESLFELCERLKESGTEGILISGGSNPLTGSVPLRKYIDDIARVKKELGIRVLVHTGLVNEETAAALQHAGVDGVMIDIIGADETIHDVYHLNSSIKDFDHSLEFLIKYGLSVRPHIILGLHYGQFLGEYTALEIIADYPVHALILVILTPLVGTAMQDVPPPDVSELEIFFQKSRLRMPKTPVLLGCARPAGKHKEAVDHAAVNSGLNGIAYPAEGIVQYARSKGLKPKFHENACSCGC